MFDSLRIRLILLLLGLLSLMAVAIGFATLSAMKRDSYSQAQQSLSVASKVFQQALANRSEQLSTSVRIVASDFGFRRAVATSEQETIASVLENHGGRIQANVSVLLSPSGELLASTQQQISQTQITILYKEMKQSGRDSLADIVLIGDDAYQLVMMPVKAPQLIAWVGMGFLLDQDLATQIKGVTDLDISFSRVTPGQQLLLATTLQQQLPATLPHNTGSSVGDGENLVFDDVIPPYLTHAVALDSQQQLFAFLHLATARWRDNYLQARSQLLLIFGLGLSLALLLAYLVARSITQPLRQLTDFARQIGQGIRATAPLIHKGEVGLLSQTLTKMQQDILQREQQILFQSQHDSLTGLANRSFVEQQLPALLHQPNLQLLLINIKDFKHINDTFGYQNGDLLLQQLANRLKSSPLLSLQPPLLLARLGGDEFLLLLPQQLPQQFPQQPPQQSRTTPLASLQFALSQEFKLGGSSMNLTLALALYVLESTEISADDALRRADIAMVHAKVRHDHLAVYQSGQDESHQRELTILRDLPLSLKSGQMFVVYQPKVSLGQQICHSSEALIRWQHPELGFIPPDEFIRLAEHSGLIALVTDWMIDQVLAQLTRWQQQQLKMKVAINLSAHDLLNPELPAQMASRLQHFQLSPSALALEVTEGAVMQDPAQVIHVLTQLRDMGIELAIDDFGTGQSSLAYLKQLPVHEVKIDRAFIKDIEHNQNDELIVQATTQLAHGLGLKVTAEGLENVAGLAKLQQHGVDTVQGYFFSKPLPAAAFEQWLQTFEPSRDRWFGRSDNSGSF
ncbi:sensor domain-containing phosphodiesterase [Rheinheimera riviphila]|uniref:Sensor domain-containing phosphodiesterase n=1 Tax=Rheinheimera riviphila TaxID=1834037 RepID=A0A437QG12_9GAMM|nr:GGDEF domain-containing phosphodiesterase [Rheinheimera riviphila]RVU33485.1 sensor domain-containing phosphodiesterase [Rheinheimera riviphila]